MDFFEDEDFEKVYDFCQITKGKKIIKLNDGSVHIIPRVNKLALSHANKHMNGENKETPIESKNISFSKLYFSRLRCRQSQKGVFENLYGAFMIADTLETLLIFLKGK